MASRGLLTIIRMALGEYLTTCPSYGFNDAPVGRQKIIPAHARFAGNTRRNNNDIGIGRSLIRVGAGQMGIMFFNRRRLG